MDKNKKRPSLKHPEPNGAKLEQQLKRNISWDEEGIEEHDKTRGQTMKINEPKTPYTEDQEKHSDEDETPYEMDKDTQKNTQKNKEVGKMDQDELHQKILEKATHFEQKLENRDAEEKKHEEFAKKRKQHYNEGKFLKAALSKKYDDDDDDDE